MMNNREIIILSSREIDSVTGGSVLGAAMSAEFGTLGALGGAELGGMWGAEAGAIGGPVGAFVGGLAGGVAGAAFGEWAASK